MSNQKYLTTSEVAKILGMQPQTLRRGLCVDGHYMGLVPHKMPNHRLLWPQSEIDRLLPKDEARAQ